MNDPRYFRSVCDVLGFRDISHIPNIWNFQSLVGVILVVNGTSVGKSNLYYKGFTSRRFERGVRYIELL